MAACLSCQAQVYSAGVYSAGVVYIDQWSIGSGAHRFDLFTKVYSLDSNGFRIFVTGTNRERLLSAVEHKEVCFQLGSHSVTVPLTTHPNPMTPMQTPFVAVLTIQGPLPTGTGASGFPSGEPSRFRSLFPTQFTGWLFFSLVLLAPCLLFWVPHRLCVALKNKPPAGPSGAVKLCRISD